MFVPSALIPVPNDFTLDDTDAMLDMISMLWTEYVKAAQKRSTIKTFLCYFLFRVMVRDLQIGERTPSHLHVLSIKDTYFSKRMTTPILESNECVVCFEVSQTRPLRCCQCYTTCATSAEAAGKSRRAQCVEATRRCRRLNTLLPCPFWGETFDTSRSGCSFE